MKFSLTVAAAVVALSSLCYAGSNDPVLMNVGGKDVRVSEFEYLYNKNKAQQETPVTIDEYLNMFVDYKLKVLAAESAGLDTTASFKSDLEKYTADLSAPFMTDSAVVDSIMRLTYDRMHRNVDVSYIMLSAEKMPVEAQRFQLLDSLRTLILNGESFEELARKYSHDRGVARKGGRFGFIPVGMMPYEVEDSAFTMKPGKISRPFNAASGSLILRVNGVREDIGRVKVRHILKLYKNDRQAAKAKADSIYNLLLNGAEFTKLAVAETEDPSGRTTGGDLPWFGSGRMVPEFEAAAFALADGELSKPVETPYGYHVILRMGHKKVGSFEDERSNIEAMIKRDARGRMGHDSYINKFAAKVGYKEHPEAIAKATDAVKGMQSCEEMVTALSSDASVIASVDNRKITVGQIASMIPSIVPADEFATRFEETYRTVKGNLLDEMARETLVNEDSNYANLLNEYRDGILLYEISDREVWGKSNTDTKGLEEFFEENRVNYTWDKPRFKGYVLMATSDSVLTAARAYIDKNEAVASDSLSKYLRREFGKDVRLERVLAPQGANAIIDYVAFGGARPESVPVWKAFAPVRSKVIAQPEEMTDIKGTVSLDYQKQLEKDWIERLHRTYKVKINDKVFNQLR